MVVRDEDLRQLLFCDFGDAHNDDRWGERSLLINFVIDLKLDTGYIFQVDVILSWKYSIPLISYVFPFQENVKMMVLMLLSISV